MSNVFLKKFKKFIFLGYRRIWEFQKLPKHEKNVNPTGEFEMLKHMWYDRNVFFKSKSTDQRYRARGDEKMQKRLLALLLCGLFLVPSSVRADVLDYEGTVNAYKQDNKNAYHFELDNGKGKEVAAVAISDTVYVSEKYTALRSVPGKKGEVLKKVLLGTALKRVAVCDNGWSKVTYESDSGKKVTGYVPTDTLGDTNFLVKTEDYLKAVKDCNILDFPGRKDGEIVGEILEYDEVERTATVNGIWSRIYYQNAEGKRRIGYIPTNVLEGQEDAKEMDKTITVVDGEEAGVIHKSEGEGVFADAIDGVTATAGAVSSVNGVQVGSPIAVSSDAVLKPLGTFRITHYCPCSICCGPWTNGITSTGVTATTNRTIAVDPTQIPYGSKVVINGQVYVAEDCGGAIKTNCIDIYVATHDEGESKGLYYTDVYLLVE